MSTDAASGNPNANLPLMKRTGLPLSPGHVGRMRNPSRTATGLSRALLHANSRDT